MNNKKLHKGNFPDPEFYSHVGTYGDWKAYAKREVTDGFINVKLVSIVPAKRANLFLRYSLNLGRFAFSKDGEFFCDTHLLESIVLDSYMKEYVRNLEDKEKPLQKRTSTLR